MVEIVIVGSGLSSWAVYKSLLAMNSDSDSITIIDPNFRFDAHLPKGELLSGQKTKFGSTHMYTNRDSEIIFSDLTNYSMANGGFSTVWGAGIRLWGSESIDRLVANHDNLYKAATFLLQDIPYSGNNQTLNIPSIFRIGEYPRPPGSDLFDFLFQPSVSRKEEIFPTPLALDVNGNAHCRGCGECLRGCPYGSIFDAGVAFDFSLAEKKLKRIQGIVQKLLPTDSRISVAFNDENGNLRYREFDAVYLCAGPIGSPSILMRSKLIPGKITVLDSQAFYFIGLKWPKKRKCSKTFALSQATICSESDSKIEFSASLYESNLDTRTRISNLLSKRFFGLKLRLPKFVDSFLFLGIGTLDSSKSGKLNLTISCDSKVLVEPIPNPQTPLEIVKSIRRISKTLRKYGLFVIPRLAIAPPPGGGFHSGGALPLNSQNVDEGGSLREHPSIHVADASLLPFLKPGAHTFTSMSLNASLILGK